MEPGVSALGEGTVKYHSAPVLALTRKGTVPGGEFDWGGRLLKCNGGAQWFPQAGWQSAVECKGIREPDGETDKSTRDESRP